LKELLIVFILDALLKALSFLFSLINHNGKNVRYLKSEVIFATPVSSMLFIAELEDSPPFT
jgi:hypothetical protein